MFLWLSAQRVLISSQSYLDVFSIRVIHSNSFPLVGLFGLWVAHKDSTEDTIFMSAGLKNADGLGFMVMVVQVVMTAVSIPLMDAWLMLAYSCLINSHK